MGCHPTDRNETNFSNTLVVRRQQPSAQNSKNERTVIMLFKATSLKGYKLEGLDGEMGKVSEFYFDDKHWAIRYLVADTGNWLTGRKVLISPHALTTMNNEKQNIAA